jgi:hypothetical protein
MSAMRIGVLLMSLVALDIAQPAASAPDSSGWIAGLVTNARRGDTLIGASVIMEGTGLGTVTDVNGSYVIGPLRAGIYTVTASYVGYLDSRNGDQHISPACTTRFDIKMKRFAPTELSLAEESLKRYVSRLKCAKLRAGKVPDTRYNNRILERAWRVWLCGHGSLTVRQYTLHGVEGGRYFNWLIIQAGTCRQVEEYDGTGYMSTEPYVRERQVAELNLVYEPGYAAGKLRHDLPPRAMLRLVYDHDRGWRDYPVFFP